MTVVQVNKLVNLFVSLQLPFVKLRFAVSVPIASCTDVLLIIHRLDILVIGDFYYILPVFNLGEGLLAEVRQCSPVIFYISILMRFSLAPSPTLIFYICYRDSYSLLSWMKKQVLGL